MSNNDHLNLERGQVTFSSDSKILAELGERLLSNRIIALGELIKNSYDADATKVYVWLSTEGKEKFLVIKDNGSGMTKDDFLTKWMVIGTRGKQDEILSKKYSRKITGSKGVGRFAARFLGSFLRLETVAFYEETKEFKLLSAEFPWGEMKAGDLSNIDIEYRILGDYSPEDIGTTLKIGGLKSNISDTNLRSVTREVLDLVEPPFISKGGRESNSKIDPGFDVLFGPPEKGVKIPSALDELADRYQAKIIIEVDGRTVTYECHYKDSSNVRKWSYDLIDNLIGRIRGEIRYYPKREGMFSKMETMSYIDATRYLKKFGGVRVFDRGFRILPYGDTNDDWLKIDKSKARNQRVWNSYITEYLFPREKLPREEKFDPALRLPGNHQLLGVVNVESFKTDSGSGAQTIISGLVPEINREGFVENESFDQLVDIVRAGTELIAVVDREESTARNKQKEEQKIENINIKINKAISYVENNKQIPAVEKKKIVTSYNDIRTSLTQTAELQKETLKSVESISILGIMAAFMAHETTTVERTSDEMISILKSIKVKDLPPRFNENLLKLERAHNLLEGHVDYVQRFLDGIQNLNVEPYKVRPQVMSALERLEFYLTDREIVYKVDIPENLYSPPVSPGVYTAVLLNLLTNAAKAVVSSLNKTNERRILITATEREGKHILRVMDSGAGIPPEIKGFVFEPLFSTTRKEEGPFGKGRGLGLYITKKVINSFGGEISIVKPESGYTTCFEVRYNVE